MATAPSFKAVGAASSSAPAWPTHAVNDIAICVACDANGATLSSPNGFALITGASISVADFGGGFSGDSSHALNFYWCRATSTSMAAPGFSTGGTYYIVTFQDCSTTGNPWDAVQTGKTTDLSSHGTGATIPSVTTTQADCLLFGAIGTNAGGAAANITVASYSGAVTTERKDDGIDLSTNQPCVACATGPKATAGASGTTTATTSAASGNTYIIIALRPDLGGNDHNKLLLMGVG